MINDPTILRLIEDDDRSPEVGLEEIASLGRSLQHAFLEVMRTIGDGDVRLLVVANPRLGSLELLLRPEINIAFEAVVILADVPGDTDGFLDRLVDAASVGAFGLELWRVVFGPEGLFERWKRQPPGQAGTLREVNLSIPDRALMNTRVQEAFKSLVTSALRSGAERVEIEVVEAAPVTIASRSDRRGYGKAALRYKREEQRRNPTRVNRGNGEPNARARYKGKEYVAFLADAGSASMVVLWGSALPVPDASASVDVQSMIIDDPEDVEFLDDAPLSFEDTAFIVVVSGAKRDWE